MYSEELIEKFIDKIAETFDVCSEMESCPKREEIKCTHNSVEDDGVCCTCCAKLYFKKMLECCDSD